MIGDVVKLMVESLLRIVFSIRLISILFNVIKVFLVINVWFFYRVFVIKLGLGKINFGRLLS